MKSSQKNSLLLLCNEHQVSATCGMQTIKLRERERERERKRKRKRERKRERVKYALKKRLIYINFIDVKITDGYRKFKSYPGYDKSFDIAIGKHIQNLNLVILNFAC